MAALPPGTFAVPQAVSGRLEAVLGAQSHLLFHLRLSHDPSRMLLYEQCNDGHHEAGPVAVCWADTELSNPNSGVLQRNSLTYWESTECYGYTLCDEVSLQDHVLIALVALPQRPLLVPLKATEKPHAIISIAERDCCLNYIQVVAKDSWATTPIVEQLVLHGEEVESGEAVSEQILAEDLGAQDICIPLAASDLALGMAEQSPRGDMDRASETAIEHKKSKSKGPEADRQMEGQKPGRHVQAVPSAETMGTSCAPEQSASAATTAGLVAETLLGTPNTDGTGFICELRASLHATKGLPTRRPLLLATVTATIGFISGYVVAYGHSTCGS